MHTYHPEHFCAGILEMKSYQTNRHTFRVVKRTKLGNHKSKRRTLTSQLEIEIECPRCTRSRSFFLTLIDYIIIA